MAIYCSIDLELTGFDPTKDEILELGFVFFKMDEGGPIVVEEWSQVFRPGQAVHPKILGLTGITQDELDAAPKFAEVRDFIQKKLETAVLVGHSVVLDVRFLEAFGIKLSGQYIDTLDLVQFILPTHHSYNLENLMHTFQVPHREAHRALADCKATIVVLERLLRVFQSFPVELRNDIEKFASKANFIWLPLLGVNLSPLEFTEGQVEQERLPQATTLPQEGIVSLPLGHDGARLALAAALNQTDKSLLVVPYNHQVLLWWREVLVTGIFSPEDTFDAQRFEKFMRQEELSLEQIAFILKVLVWKYTNWQTQTVLDLNLSFSGGQYRFAITGGKPQLWQESLVACCSQQTFLHFAERNIQIQDKESNRQLIIPDLERMENAITTGICDHISWTYIVYLLRSVYNPETQSGLQQHRDVIESALAATDLFFGLLSLQLNKQFPTSTYITYANLNSESYTFSRLHEAALSYTDQLETISKKLHRDDIARFIIMLKNFFTDQDDRVKWVELGQNRCILFNYPIEIAHIFSNAAAAYPRQLYILEAGNTQVEQYLVKRFGLESKILITAQLPPLARNVKCSLVQQLKTHEEIFHLVMEQTAPTVVLFSDPSDIKDFYKSYYTELKKNYAVFAQGYSGGSNKMMRNFGIRPSSILLVTTALLVRSTLPKLKASSIIWTGFSLENKIKHPYEQALAERWQGRTSFAAIRSLQHLNAVLRLCYSSQLRTVTLGVQGMGQDDKQSLIQALARVPFLKIE